MLKLVTAEIDGIGHDETKKKLTSSIKKRAEAVGLQPHLHKVVEEQRVQQRAA